MERSLTLDTPLSIATSREAAPQAFADTADFVSQWSGEGAALLFSKAALVQQTKFFLDNFPGKTTYAVKANPDAPVLEALFEQGISEYDAASLGEIALLRKLLPRAVINFNNPIRTSKDLHAAYHAYDVRSFVVDDTAGMQQLETLGATNIEVTVRLKLAHESAAYNFGSKFGASPEAAISILQSAKFAGYEQVSMAFHPGSQCSSVEVYQKYIDACVRCASSADVQLARLNVGGGFPVAYEGTSLPTLSEFFAAIAERVTSHYGNDGPRLLCEPGRAIVAPSCSLVCRVVHVREEGPVFIGDGVYGCLHEQFFMDARLPTNIWRDGKLLSRDGPERELFGPTCDPSDKLASRYQLREDIRVGDCIEFKLMGAYSTATATRFNGMEPAQYVLVGTA